MTIANTLQQRLNVVGCPYELIPHRHSGSSHESAEAAHVDEGHLAKAVVLQDDHGFVMAVLPADRYLRLHAARDALGRPGLELAPENNAESLFADCRPGAIPPVGPAYGLETLLDEGFINLAHVYVEAGDHRHLVKLSGGSFAKLLAGARGGHFANDR